MAGKYSYPGIYIEEIPSGVRPIAGVSTSNTAFVGFFSRGPMNDPVRITSFGDFERRFGGLDPNSEASYAIQQYYLNGGQVAFVVRVASGTPRAASRDFLGEGSTPQLALTVAARYEGEWGDNLQVGIGHIFDNAGNRDPDNYNLVVREVVPINNRPQVVNSEIFRNLSTNPTDPAAADAVINEESALIRITSMGPGVLPTTTAAPPMPPSTIPADITATTIMSNAGNQANFRRLGDATGGQDGNPPTSTELVAGVNTLDQILPEIFNILCLPDAAELGVIDFGNVYTMATAFCRDRRAFLIVDIPENIDSQEDMSDWMTTVGDNLRDENAAVYFPRLRIPDSLASGRLRNVGPSGTLAGVYARTDANRGVWKAPAGIEADLRNAQVVVKMTDLENGALNPFGINALRTFPVYGNVSWGSRTMMGADQIASEWSQIPVRRLALYIEESLYQGLKWVVFEPNDEPLWGLIRLNVGAFMNGLFRRGAFQGSSPRDAYLVKCDAETTTQNDINNGIVNIIVGFAPLKPAEFVIIKLLQLAGQIAT